MVGNLVQGNRLAVAQGRDIGFSDDGERKVHFKWGHILYHTWGEFIYVILALLGAIFAILSSALYFSIQTASIDNRSAAMESKYVAGSRFIYAAQL